MPNSRSAFLKKDGIAFHGSDYASSSGSGQRPESRTTWGRQSHTTSGSYRSRPPSKRIVQQIAVAPRRNIDATPGADHTSQSGQPGPPLGTGANHLDPYNAWRRWVSQLIFLDRKRITLCLRYYSCTTTKHIMESTDSGQALSGPHDGSSIFDKDDRTTPPHPYRPLQPRPFSMPYPSTTGNNRKDQAEPGGAERATKGKGPGRRKRAAASTFGATKHADVDAIPALYVIRCPMGCEQSLWRDTTLDIPNGYMLTQQARIRCKHCGRDFRTNKGKCITCSFFPSQCFCTIDTRESTKLIKHPNTIQHMFAQQSAEYGEGDLSADGDYPTPTHIDITNKHDPRIADPTEFDHIPGDITRACIAPKDAPHAYIFDHKHFTPAGQ